MWCPPFFMQFCDLYKIVILHNNEIINIYCFVLSFRLDEYRCFLRLKMNKKGNWNE